MPVVPSAPTSVDIARAKQLLLDELLVDFPFKDDASRAHAIGALLLPFVRQMIAGPTPLNLVDAPTAGTGKGLLAEVICLIALGRHAEFMPEAENAAEWRKGITAALVGGANILLIDNIAKKLDSGPLAAALTAPVWRDRLLGMSKQASMPVTTCWFATGNNLRASGELTRRSVWIRMDAKLERPWERTGFKHPQLPDWVLAHRGKSCGLRWS